MKITPQGLPRSKKKNNQVTDAPISAPPKSAPKQIENKVAPPAYEPEPPPEVYNAPPEPEPVRSAEKQRAKAAAFKGGVAAADEGEFWHLKATAEQGLELQGKIIRHLRKDNSPASARVMRLIARGVAVRERDEYIAFVSPDDVFLAMGDQSVKSVLNSALDELGVKKRARIERTEDDLYQQDIARAKVLFTHDGVIISE